MSSEPVFVVPALPPAGEFTLGGDEGRHAAQVKRLRAGERITLTDGAGNWAPATVTGSSGRTLTVAVGDAHVDPAPELTLTLVQALPKGERSDLAVELATEAGIDEIIPWQSERCVSRWDGAPEKATRGRERWQRVATEAAKQSRRRRIPSVRPLATTVEICHEIATATAALVLHEAGAVAFGDLDLPTAGRLLLIVGPEGGLSDAEIDRFTAAGAQAVQLGPEVLRTSTAAAVALGALGVPTGRWPSRRRHTSRADPLR